MFAGLAMSTDGSGAAMPGNARRVSSAAQPAHTSVAPKVRVLGAPLVAQSATTARA